MLHSSHQIQDFSQLKGQNELSSQCDNSSVTRVSYENSLESQPKETKVTVGTTMTLVQNQKCQLEVINISPMRKASRRKSRPYRALSKDDKTSGYVMTIGFGEDPVIIKSVNCLDKDFLILESKREELHFPRESNNTSDFKTLGANEPGCADGSEADFAFGGDEVLGDDSMNGIVHEETGLSPNEEEYDNELSEDENNDEEDFENTDDLLSMASEDSLDLWIQSSYTI